MTFMFLRLDLFTEVAMDIYWHVKNGGWGAVAVYFFSLAVLIYLDIPFVTSDRLMLVVAGGPVLLLMFTVYVGIDSLNEFWAGGNLKRSTKRIDEITGDNDFYESSSTEIKKSVDDFDDKAYSHHISILSGLILSVVVPATGYTVGGLPGVILGVLVGSVLFQTLSVRSYRELNKLARKLSTPYEENYENQ